MKSKKMFILCALLGVSFISAGTVAYIHNEVDTPVKAEAVGETTTFDNYLFLKPNSNWLTDNARFAAYFFTGNPNTETWVDMSSEGSIISGNFSYNFAVNFPDYYWVEIPDGFDNSTVVFCRMNPAKTENNWDNKWNQTGDLPFSSEKGKCYSISEWGSSGSWNSVSANVPTLDREIYVKSTSSSLNFHCFNSSASTIWPGIAMESVGTNLFKATIPSNFTSAVINDGTNQTANIDLITANASSTNGNIQGYTLDTSGTNWSYSYGFISESPMTSSNFVLWLYRSGHYSSGFTYAFHYWNEEGTINHEIFPTYAEVNHTEWHAKYVISSEAIGCKSQFKVYTSSGTYTTSSTEEVFLSTYNNGEAQVTAASASSVTIAYSQKSSNTCTAAAAKTILENYYTCLNNDYNGYSQINKICENWGFSEGTADCDTTMMNDYASISDYASGTKTNSISVSAKISEMKKMASLSSAQAVKLSTLINFNDNSTTVAVVTIASLISLAVIIAMILRKRHLSVNK